MRIRIPLRLINAILACAVVVLGFKLLRSRQSVSNIEWAFLADFSSKNEDGNTFYRRPRVFHLKDEPMENYFVEVGNQKCNRLGVDVERSFRTESCFCVNEKVKGPDCGIPDIIYKTVKHGPKRFLTFPRRSRPRHLISILPVNHEFDMLEARIVQNSKYVDVFIIQESKYSNSGEERELLLLDSLRRGWLKEFHSKIIYILCDSQPPNGFSDGKKTDEFMRSHLSKEAFKLLSELRLDDLLIFSDADELLKEEILAFVKVYDGLPDVIYAKYIWSIFGFFWQVDPKIYGHTQSIEPAIFTVNYLKESFKWDLSKVRGQKRKSERKLKASEWVLERAGWHCSWCFTPAGIQRKLKDAPLSDYPRHGDYPAKNQLPFIKRMIKNGLYFDLSRIGNNIEVNSTMDPEYAPPYFLQQPERFKHLLHNIYHNITQQNNITINKMN